MTILIPGVSELLKYGYPPEPGFNIAPTEGPQKARLFDDASYQNLFVTSTPVSNYPLTMACWLNCDDISYDQIVFTVGDKDVSNHYHALMVNEVSGITYLQSRVIDGGAPANANTTASISANTWHHGCIVHASLTDRAVLLDGGSKGTDTTSRTPANLDAVRIAGRIDDGSLQPYSGAIAHAAIWNAALSDSEVALLASGVSPLLVRRDALVAYWPLLGDDRDVIGQYHMTSVNGPTWTAFPDLVRTKPAIKRIWSSAPLYTAPVKPVTIGYEKPPIGETFTVNWSSPQAKELKAWYPVAKPTGSVIREQMAGAHGTLLSNVGWAYDARLGWGVKRLADNNDYVTISPATAMPLFGWNYPFSISAWVMINSKAQWSCIFGDGNAINDYISCYTQQGDAANALPGFYMYPAATASINRSAANSAENYLALNTPYHLAFTFDPSLTGYNRFQIYINARSCGAAGGATGTTGSAYVTPTSPQILNNPVWDEPFDGAVWNLRLYQRTLSPADVAHLYNRATRFDLYKPAIRVGGIAEVEAEEQPYYAKTGSFNIDSSITTGNDQSITGLGFTPKIVLFWWSGSTATVDNVASGSIRHGFGAATGSSERYCTASASDDATASSDCCAGQWNDCVIKVFSDGDGTVDGAADFKSMDADGFTLTMDDQFGSDWRISYLALGGSDLTNVKVGSARQPASTGNYSVTGVGFRPDALITFGALASNDETYSQATVHAMFVGMATGSSNQGVCALWGYDNQTAAQTDSYGYNGEVTARISVGAAVYYRSSFVSFDADGFTLNQLEGTDQRYYWYVALAGGQYEVGELTTRTDGNDIEEDLAGSFEPAAILFASANRAHSTQDAASAHGRLSIGAGTSTSNRAVQAISDEDAVADMETAYTNQDDAVYAHVIDDAIEALMDIKSFDADGFTCVMDDTETSACWVTYLAFGAAAEEEPPTGIVPRIMAFLSRFRRV